MYSQEDRQNMKDFIKRMFKDKVTDAELNGTDEQLKKLHDEAYSYSEWGL